MDSLTPAIVMDLRLSCPSLRNLGRGVNMGVPYILWLPADEVFCLHAYGSPQAKHPDASILGLMLKNERAEPGFIRRVLSPAEPCDAASLNPHARALYIKRRAAERASAEAYRAEQAAALLRRASLLDPAKLTLDDLD